MCLTELTGFLQSCFVNCSTLPTIYNYLYFRCSQRGPFSYLLTAGTCMVHWPQLDNDQRLNHFSLKHQAFPRPRPRHTHTHQKALDKSILLFSRKDGLFKSRDQTNGCIRGRLNKSRPRKLNCFALRVSQTVFTG